MTFAATLLRIAKQAFMDPSARHEPNRTEVNIARYAHADPDTLTARLQELDDEWDLDRTVGTFTAAASLVGIILGRRARWAGLITIPVILVGGYLLQRSAQHSPRSQGLVRRLGFRSRQEIDAERYALRALRGDFKDPRYTEAASHQGGFMQQLLGAVTG